MPLFDSFFDGPMAEKPLHVRIAALYLRWQCDRDGFVTITAKRLARVANMTSEQAEEALAVLSAEDLESLSKAEGGRFLLEQPEPNRYMVVNKRAYDALMRGEMRRGADRERKREERAQRAAAGALAAVVTERATDGEPVEPSDPRLEGYAAGVALFQRPGGEPEAAWHAIVERLGCEPADLLAALRWAAGKAFWRQHLVTLEGLIKGPSERWPIETLYAQWRASAPEEDQLRRKREQDQAAIDAAQRRYQAEVRARTGSGAVPAEEPPGEG